MNEEIQRFWDEKLERGFKGVWIPKEIYLSNDISWTEKILLVEIDSLDSGNGCWATNKYFADFLGKSESRIASSISSLRKEGWIEDVSFDGRNRYISVKVGLLKTARQGYSGKAGLPKTARQGCQKRQGRVAKNGNESREDFPYNVSTEGQKESDVTPNNTVNNTTKRGNSSELPNTLLEKEETDLRGYTTVPVDDEGNPIHQKNKDTAPPRTDKFLGIVEKKRGGRFSNRPAQIASIKRMNKAGIELKTMGKRWQKLCEEEYWLHNERVPDMMSVEKSFDTKPPTEDEL